MSVMLQVRLTALQVRPTDAPREPPSSARLDGSSTAVAQSSVLKRNPTSTVIAAGLGTVVGFVDGAIEVVAEDTVDVLLVVDVVILQAANGPRVYRLKASVSRPTSVRQSLSTVINPSMLQLNCPRRFCRPDVNASITKLSWSTVPRQDDETIPTNPGSLGTSLHSNGGRAAVHVSTMSLSVSVSRAQKVLSVMAR